MTTPTCKATTLKCCFGCTSSWCELVDERGAKDNSASALPPAGRPAVAPDAAGGAAMSTRDEDVVARLVEALRDGLRQGMPYVDNLAAACLSAVREIADRRAAEAYDSAATTCDEEGEPGLAWSFRHRAAALRGEA